MKIENSYLRIKTAAGGICIAIVAAFTSFSPEAEAITFDGSSSGTFENPAGPPGMVVSGVGTNVFDWGIPANGSVTSRLRFQGESFAGIPLDQFFVIGDLTYRNGTAFAGTEADSVDLLASLVFTAPAGIPLQNLTFGFQIVNTPNVGDQEADADSIQLTSLFPSTTFVLEGIEYTLETGFGSVENGGFVEQDSFHVFEDRRASVELIGRITAAQPVPDAGSTLALMAIAIAGLGGLRQYLTARA